MFVTILAVVTLLVVGTAVIVRVCRPDPQPCRHDSDWTETRWLAGDGTPMVRFECGGCEFVDEGHVHGDGVAWCGRTRVETRDGVTTRTETPA